FVPLRLKSVPVSNGAASIEIAPVAEIQSIVALDRSLPEIQQRIGDRPVAVEVGAVRPQLRPQGAFGAGLQLGGQISAAEERFAAGVRLLIQKGDRVGNPVLAQVAVVVAVAG